MKEINMLSSKAMTIKLDPELPDTLPLNQISEEHPAGLHAEQDEAELALKNALRYIPEELHEKLAPNSWKSSQPEAVFTVTGSGKGAHLGRPSANTRNCIEGKAFQVMIGNNLDFE